MNNLMIIFSEDGTMDRYIELIRLFEEKLRKLSVISSLKRGNP